MASRTSTNEMIITKITFGKTIPTGPFGNDRPGVVEASLEDGETLESAWTELNKRAIAWHRGEYPEIYREGGQPVQSLATIQTGRGHEDKRLSDMIASIYACTEIEGEAGILSFRRIAITTPETHAAYNQRYNELSNKKNINLP